MLTSFQYDETESVGQKADAHVLQHALRKLYSDPSFAIICSFFNKFAVFLGMKPQCFAKIESMFTSFHITGKVDRDLIDLHLTLMRKLAFKSAKLDAWEKYLLKFCSLLPSLESEYLQLERYGYLHTSSTTKLSILKALCESQFDFNSKVKESLLNSCSASDLRLLPIGFDKEGLAYLYQQDADLVIRVYSAEQDDHSGGSWNLVAKLDFLNFTLLLFHSFKLIYLSFTITNQVFRSKEELEHLVMGLKNRLDFKYLSNALIHLEGFFLLFLNGQKTENEKQLGILPKFMTKRGSLLDTYQDESTVKRKLVKTIRKKKKKVVEEELKKENSTPPVELIDDIPDEVKPFLDRRILPRRSARSAAINQMKELTAPLRPQTGRKKNQQIKKQSQFDNTRRIKINDKSNDVDGSVNGDENDEEEERYDDTDDFALAEDSSTSSDDEFMPKSELKKKNRNSRRRRRKKVDVEKDPFEVVESEEDDDSDNNQEKAKKERKKATDETLCMKCNKSSNPEVVLLLCDLCDEAWHTWCLHPMLWYVPDDDWFCPNCQQAMLINKFSDVLITLEEQVKQKAADDKKKEAEAERLKREMEYIGTSLNTIVDTVFLFLKRFYRVKYEEESSDLLEESDEGGGERKSKKKAIRRLGNYPQKPVVPIALSRSRRHVAKVDYNFGAYDELIQEAVKNIDEAAARQMSPVTVRSKSGAGRGKDMSNIINAGKKRIPSNPDDIHDNKGVESKYWCFICILFHYIHIRMIANTGRLTKSRHRLNDLNVDDMTESDTDEYQDNDSASVSDPSDDTDEYVPSDNSHTKRPTKRTYSNRRTQSDDDFVVSGSESEYEPSRKKSQKSKNVKVRGRRKRVEWSSSDEDFTSELSDSYQSGESSSNNERLTKRRAVSKWAPRASSSDVEGSIDSTQRTAAGRPLRQAVAKRSSMSIDNEVEEDAENDEIEQELKRVHHIGSGRAAQSSDEFEPEDEEEEDDDGDDDDDDDDDDTVGEEEMENDDAHSDGDEKREQKDEEMRSGRIVVKEEVDDESRKGMTYTTENLLSTDCIKMEENLDVMPPSASGNEFISNSNIVSQSSIDDVKIREMKQKTTAALEMSNAEDIKLEDKRITDGKMEKVEMLNVAPACANVTSFLPPSCFPSTSADVSSLNPASVMQQMARLASSSVAPVRQFESSCVAYQSMLQTTSPPFISNGDLPFVHSGIFRPISGTAYQLRQPTFLRAPTTMIQPGVNPLLAGWPHYPPPNSFPTNIPLPPVVTTAVSSSTTDSETLGNVLATAMDY
ncbi:unnamed protein product [Thelazia callipaeda]|uniref:PHD-type domain-containing protein n=1 Tax=Thelazia callipaeda TaxID=103827 RepID=A0A0N5CZF4_THECL|nr:unnamed protein product [Thelazia callipaeda]